MYKWSSFSLAELRKVAKAYKDHTKVPAPSKMNKKDLIVLLDKHLLLDKDTAEIKVKATMESSLGEVERMPKKMKMSKVPSAPALPPMVEDKSYKKRVGKSKVPPPKMLDEEQMKSASSDAMDMAKLAMELLQEVMEKMKPEEKRKENFEKEMKELKKYKKSYEKLDKMEFTRAVDDKMGNLSDKAQKIITQNPLLQNELRQGYFLDRNENKIYFKIFNYTSNTRTSVSFIYFERPDGTKVDFTSIKDKSWDAKKTKMTKEEWEFYKQSSLFKLRESFYEDEGYEAMSKVIGTMSYFNNPGNVKELWIKEPTIEITGGKQFKKFYEELF